MTPQPSKMRYIELLAPAKDCDTAIDAIDCGADAVYIGGTGFGARHAATNSTQDIARVAAHAHLFGAKVYATLNTLLFEEEIGRAQRLAEDLAAAGVDALIVQDMAYCRMGLPLPLHASTQTNCADPERVRFFGEAGFARAILERSLSIDEIREIRSRTSIGLEAFVHGAICVSMSGRCFLSRSMGPRSGNRGECSQPCRLAYDLTDGRGNTLEKGRHLLSVRDMDLSARLGEMIDAGVNSFKIEGRLKDRAYVRNAVAHYRRLLDREIALRDDCRRASAGHSEVGFEPDPTKSFTRAAGEYFFDGKRAGVASFDTPKATGERIGRIKSMSGGRVTLDCGHDLANGDGICFMSDGVLVGTNINGVDGRSILPNRTDGMRVGTEIFRNFNRRFNLGVERARIRRAIDAVATIRFDAEMVSVTVTDSEGVRGEAVLRSEFVEAENREKMERLIREQLAKSGGTAFDVTEVRIDGKTGFLPASALASLRREALERLAEARMAARPRPVPFRENPEARYPDRRLTEQDNVTNSAARAFYADHGVAEIEPGLDLSATTRGHRVMISDYCIRRETGRCPKQGGDINAASLYLEHGRKRYRLDFDCRRCRMSLTDESE